MLYNARIRVMRKGKVTTETFVVEQRTPKLAIRDARKLFNLDKELWQERLLAIWSVEAAKEDNQ